MTFDFSWAFNAGKVKCQDLTPIVRWICERYVNVHGAKPMGESAREFPGRMMTTSYRILWEVGGE